MDTARPGEPAATAAVEEHAEVTLFEGRPAVVPSAGALLLCIVTVGIAALFLWIRSLGRHFRVTTERIVVETGILSKTTQQVDLYRIEDYVAERPFGQRLLGTGNLVVRSSDQTTPVVRLDALRVDVVALYERLRKATEADKRRRGVRVVDFGAGAIE